MAKKQFVVVSERVDSPSLEAVRRRVERRGFAVRTEIAGIGTLIGSADESRLEELKGVEGVISVSEEREVGLPPRGSKGPV